MIERNGLARILVPLVLLVPFLVSMSAPAGPLLPNPAPAIAPGEQRLPSPAVPGWNYDEIESGVVTLWGMQNSLALDSANRPHVIYYDYPDGLKYAYYDGTAWQKQVLDGSPGSLALDEADRPHISYGADSNVKYAYFDGTTWQIQTVDSGGYSSLALDDANLPHIAYNDPYARLKHAYYDGANWHIETVDLAGEVGLLSISLALDSLGRPCISYRDPNQVVKYAYYSSGWHVETVEDAGGGASTTSLSLDYADRPHIAYGGSGDLHLAYYSGTSWQIETVDSSQGYDDYASLALDAADRPQIIYYHSFDGFTGELRYAYYNSLYWQVETVDAGEGRVGEYTSLALDGEGQPHVVYSDEVRSNVKHAWKETNVKRPVIVIPGTGGSANFPCFLFAANCGDEGAWGWMPTAQTYYQPLIDRLAAAGYTEDNGYLSFMFYDFRQPPADNAAWLNTKIDQVKSETGAVYVDLVAHSMGGLVARAYIQGDMYDYDVAHLITLGTPHNGIPMLYPYWQAGCLYNIDTGARVGFYVLLRRWVTPPHIPWVWSLRAIMPSIQDILPTADYLYDEEHGGEVKPEANMTHRNTYLPALNDGLPTLFARTDVSTFAGQNLATPVRYFVRDRHLWEWPDWDDGRPNWTREPEFKAMVGDDTVPAASAELPSAHVVEFPGVHHGWLPGTPAVVDAVLNTLGIPLPPAGEESPAAVQAEQQIIMMVVDGPAGATVTDPLGRSVGPGGVSIPGAEYVSSPGDPFKLILIPAPEEGRFEVAVQGEGSGVYELDLADTFGPPTTVISDLLSLWDSPRSQIEPGVTVIFALTYTVETSPTTNLIAETPIVAVPVWVGSSRVDGRARPGQSVEIRDADSHALLGSGPADADGHFGAWLAVPLEHGQRIYPLSNGVAGVPVTVNTWAIYMPVLFRNH